MTLDANIYGPLEQTNFLGASVVGFQAVLGWNQQQSSLTVNLVEDNCPNNLQTFSPVAIGEPCYFEFPAGTGIVTPTTRENIFKFYGLLQSYTIESDVNGYPVQSVTVVDPRELLAGVQIILDGYIGDTLFASNVMNVYGYLEHRGSLDSYVFGNSGKNSQGIQWNVIRTVIGQMTTPLSVFSFFGGRVKYGTTSYMVDLSLMPAMPSEYRIGGTVVDLLSMISQVCQDAGYDFFVELVYSQTLGNVIKIRTVSRKFQPDLTAISSFINGLPTGTWVSKSVGQELRNEDTNSVMIGGQVTALWRVPQGFADNCGNMIEDEEGDNIIQFMGLDGNNNILPILYDDEENDYYVDLLIPITFNFTEITFNHDYYRMYFTELREAIIGYEEWETYTQYIINGYNFDLENATILDSNFMPQFIGAAQNNQQAFNPAMFFNRTLIRDEYLNRELGELYEQVKKYAMDFYAKLYAVRLPFAAPACGSDAAIFSTQAYYDVESDQIITSWNPVDGGYVMENDSPLGLSDLGKEFFSLPDNRIQAFAVFDNINTIDLTELDTSQYWIEDGLLYVRAEASVQVQFENRSAALDNDTSLYSFETPAEQIFASVKDPGARAIISLPEPIYKKDPTELLSVQTLIKIYEVQTGQQVTDQIKINLSKMATGGGGDQLPSFMGRRAAVPKYIAIPLQSNVLTYGPWYFFSGILGKTRYDQNLDLVPWNYGGFDPLNLAANRLVRENVTRMKIGEFGSVEFAGIPTKNLGDMLVEGGPNINNISIQLSTQGFTTSYRLETFTPAFGTMAKYNADRIKQLGNLVDQQKKYIRQLYLQVSRIGTKKPIE